MRGRRAPLVPLGPLLHALCRGPAARYGPRGSQGRDHAWEPTPTSWLSIPGERAHRRARAPLSSGRSPIHGPRGDRAVKQVLVRGATVFASARCARRPAAAWVRPRARERIAECISTAQEQAQRAAELARSAGGHGKAILRMLENNLENAERPRAVIYAGSAMPRATGSYDLIVRRSRRWIMIRRSSYSRSSRPALSPRPPLADRGDRETAPRRPLGEHDRFRDYRPPASRCTAG